MDSMGTKHEKELAYEAGRSIMSEPSERRSVDACPFSPVDHPDQRAAWLDGFESALDDQTDHRGALKAARGE